MPGYQLLQKKYLAPPLPANKGIAANRRWIGFLDFMRELQQEDFPYDDESNLLVEGLEDVLLFARPDMAAMARQIHHLLQRRAGDFERFNCGWVQIVFRNELKRGEKLNVIYPGNIELPIYLIFDSPPAIYEPDDSIWYRCEFNLSSIT